MNITLGTRLMLLRKESGLKQKDLAGLSGISQAYIAKIERGRVTNVGIEYIFALAKALDVRPAYLLGLSDVVVDEDELLAVADGPARYAVDPAVKEILELMEGMDGGQRQQLIGIARVLAGGQRVIG